MLSLPGIGATKKQRFKIILRTGVNVKVHVWQCSQEAITVVTGGQRDITYTERERNWGNGSGRSRGREGGAWQRPLHRRLSQMTKGSMETEISSYLTFYESSLRRRLCLM